MNLTKLALRRPVSAVLIIIMIILFGFTSFGDLEQELTPEMETPMLMIMTVYSGAGPEDVEDLITSPLEDAIASLSDVKTVTSRSAENQSMIMIQYEYGTDMDEAYDALKRSVDSAQRSLPDSVSSPTIMELAMDQSATMNLSVTGDVPGGLYNYVDNNIVPELEKLTGVASVSTYGGQQEYVSITLNSEALQQYGLTMSSVVSAVSTADFSMPAGDVDVGTLNLSVSTGMSYKTLESLKNIPISVGSGQVVLLSDIATITETQREMEMLSRYDGQDTVTIGIAKQQSATAQQVSAAVHQTITQLQSEAGDSLSITVTSDSYESIKSSLDSVRSTLIIAIIISMVILLLFFGDIKASLITASSMPVSVLIAFIFMKYADFSLNIISMASLVIGVGMMVDNSIVVLESCFRSRAEGKTLYDAALEGTKAVTASIVASTITTIVVYLPLALIEGMSGQLFKPLGFIIAFTMVASLISAMTIVPLAFYFYQPKEKETAPLSRPLKKLTNAYEKLLRKSIYRKKTVFAITAILLIISILSVSGISMELMPATDEGTISVSVSTRPGLRFEEQSQILERVEAVIVENEDVEHYTLRGTSFTVDLRDDRSQSTADIISQWKVDMRSILDCDIEISNSSAMSSMTMASDQSRFVLRGTDYDELKSAATNLVKNLNNRSDVTYAASSLSSGAPALKIEIDPIKAAAEGFTPSQVASTVNAIMTGQEATTIIEDGEEKSVYVEYPTEQYKSVEDLQGITLMTAAGQSLPLSDIAEIVYVDSPQSISKENGYYNVTLTVEVAPDNLAASKQEISQMVYGAALPESVSFGTNSIQQSMDEEFSELYGALFSAIVLVFMVMAMQFESPRFSLMVMVCVPFSFIGSLLILSITGFSISMTSLLGFLMLVGSVVNNGILYVDTVNTYKQTMSREDALVQAGVTRLRPILMTSLTTTLSLLPLAIGIGENAEMMQGFAVVAIGGMLASTVLALLLLPTFYMAMDRKTLTPPRYSIRQFFKSKRHKSDAPIV